MAHMSELSWPQAEEELAAGTVILPIGALEAHGPHLPLGTDNYIAQALANKLAEEIKAPLLPLLPLGQVWSLQNFPGSISLSTETLISLLVDIAGSLAEQDVELLVIVNGHFGNRQVLKEAARKVREKYKIKILRFTHPGLSELEAKYIDSSRPHENYLHAEEIETSLMLNIKEELVDMKQAIKVYPDFPVYFDSYSIPWEEISPQGVLGDPTSASKMKGKQLLQGIADNMKQIVLAFRKEEL